MAARYDKIVPVRADDALLAALDRALAKARAARPGVRLTLADVVRTYLWDGAKRDGVSAAKQASA